MKYFCYDSALNKEYTLIQLMQRYPKYTNVFAGTNDEGIWDAAPWLFELTGNPYELKGQPLIQLDHSIVFETKEPVRQVLDYLQSKIYIKQNGQDKYFRIWDERVLLKSIVTWSLKDVQDFFNVFDAFYTESEEETFVNKWTLHTNGKIAPAKILKTDALPIIKTEEELDKEYEERHKPKTVTVKQQPKTEIEEPGKKETGEEKPQRRRFLTD